MEPLFVGLWFMVLGLGFGTIVFCFRVHVFRVRVWNHFFALWFMVLGLRFGTIVFRFRVYGFRVTVWNHCL